MTFEAYLTNIHVKTGKSPEDFHALAIEKGLMNADTKAMQIVGWLKEEFALGHGHAMAIWCAFQKNGWTGPN
jgi:hypothetical protein